MTQGVLVHLKYVFGPGPSQRKYHSCSTKSKAVTVTTLDFFLVFNISGFDSGYF